MPFRIANRSLLDQRLDLSLLCYGVLLHYVKASSMTTLRSRESPQCTVSALDLSYHQNPKASEEEEITRGVFKNDLQATSIYSAMFRIDGGNFFAVRP